MTSSSCTTNAAASTPPPPFDDPNVTDPLECPPLRWGMLGCGRVSHDFTQALKHLPTQKVVACSARSADSAKTFAEKHGIGKSCKSTHDEALPLKYICFNSSSMLLLSDDFIPSGIQFSSNCALNILFIPDTTN